MNDGRLRKEIKKKDPEKDRTLRKKRRRWSNKIKTRVNSRNTQSAFLDLYDFSSEKEVFRLNFLCLKLKHKNKFFLRFLMWFRKPQLKLGDKIGLRCLCGLWDLLCVEEKFVSFMRWSSNVWLILVDLKFRLQKEFAVFDHVNLLCVCMSLCIQFQSNDSVLHNFSNLETRHDCNSIKPSFF